MPSPAMTSAPISRERVKIWPRVHDLGHRPRQDLGSMNQPRFQLLRIVREITATAVDAEVQQGRQLLGVGHAVGQLSLNGDGLEVAGNLLKDKRSIRARKGDGYDGRSRDEIEE